ncbi:Hypothetical protein PHPALM_15139 [Phytophthora palmivora]|uniref:Uncharacterized protein n=1 Tax=Phytophthora palmivora TaxID=4796 RepID=A0A2P4XSZ5_9STRA|nr:Hypothetical protein PHPALM_15139 [Phytophthora palmivora]
MPYGLGGNTRREVNPEMADLIAKMTQAGIGKYGQQLSYGTKSEVDKPFGPIAELNIKCRAERAEEVDVLVALYMSRLNELGQDQPVRHYQPTYVNPQWISASILTPLTSKTRDVSRVALDKRFSPGTKRTLNYNIATLCWK